jgi:hypothetical protein
MAETSAKEAKEKRTEGVLFWVCIRFLVADDCFFFCFVWRVEAERFALRIQALSQAALLVQLSHPMHSCFRSDMPNDS